MLKRSCYLEVPCVFGFLTLKTGRVYPLHTALGLIPKRKTATTKGKSNICSIVRIFIKHFFLQYYDYQVYDYACKNKF